MTARRTPAPATGAASDPAGSLSAAGRGTSAPARVSFCSLSACESGMVGDAFTRPAAREAAPAPAMGDFMTHWKAVSALLGACARRRRRAASRGALPARAPGCARARRGLLAGRGAPPTGKAGMMRPRTARWAGRGAVRGTLLRGRTRARRAARACVRRVPAPTRTLSLPAGARRPAGRPPAPAPPHAPRPTPRGTHAHATRPRTPAARPPTHPALQPAAGYGAAISAALHHSFWLGQHAPRLGRACGALPFGAAGPLFPRGAAVSQTLRATGARPTP